MDASQESGVEGAVAATLTDDEIKTRRSATSPRASFDDSDTGDDTGDTGDTSDTSDAGDTGDTADTGDDAGDAGA